MIAKKQITLNQFIDKLGLETLYIKGIPVVRYVVDYPEVIYRFFLNEVVIIETKFVSKSYELKELELELVKLFSTLMYLNQDKMDKIAEDTLCILEVINNSLENKFDKYKMAEKIYNIEFDKSNISFSITDHHIINKQHLDFEEARELYNKALKTSNINDNIMIACQVINERVINKDFIRLNAKDYLRGSNGRDINSIAVNAFKLYNEIVKKPKNWKRAIEEQPSVYMVGCSYNAQNLVNALYDCLDEQHQLYLEIDKTHNTIEKDRYLKLLKYENKPKYELPNLSWKEAFNN